MKTRTKWVITIIVVSYLGACIVDSIRDDNKPSTTTTTSTSTTTTTRFQYYEENWGNYEPEPPYYEYEYIPEEPEYCWGSGVYSDC